jgi:heme-degrading monooxygenase HmoA
MICTLTARRLTPGAYEEFRAAWDPAHADDEALHGWTRIYHCRDLADPDVVLSFGLFDGTRDALREAQARLGRNAQVDRVDPHVEQVLLDGSFEVVEQLEP